MRPSRPVLLAILALLLAACVPDAPAPGLAVDFEAPYTLDSGDRLRVVVFGQDGLSNSYAVDVAGKISMPLIGAVRARGMTTAQLSDSISTRLRQGYIREPHVAVEVEAYRPFFILGEVTTPGQFPYVPDMTVETAVAVAGTGVRFVSEPWRSFVRVSSSDGSTSCRCMSGTIAAGCAALPSPPAVPASTTTSVSSWATVP